MWQEINLFYQANFALIANLSLVLNILTFFAWMLLFIYVLLVLKYPVRYVTRYFRNGRSKIKFDRARRYTDSDGIAWYKTLWSRTLEPIPDESCIDTTTRGKDWVESRLFEGGVRQYLRDIPTKGNEFEGLTTTDTVFLVEQWEKSRDEMMDWFKSHMFQIVGIVAIVVMVCVAGGITYYGLKEMRAQSDTNARVAESYISASERLADRIDPRQKASPNEFTQDGLRPA